MPNLLEDFNAIPAQANRLVVANISRVEAGSVWAVAPAFNLTHEFGPMPMADAAYAEIGARVLVAFDEQGTPWAIGADVTKPEGADLPIGGMCEYAGSGDVSETLVVAEGRSLLRAAYPILFGRIGTTHGAADGTHFNIPDARGRGAVAPDAGAGRLASNNTLGATGGAQLVTLTEAKLPAHTHVQNSHNHTQDAHTHVQDAHTHVQDAHTHTQNSHNHTQDSHNHTQNSHNHTQNAHNHTPISATQFMVRNNVAGLGGTGSSWGHMQAQDASTQNATATNIATTATNIATTATNQAATATNQNATATNQNATATNQNATATNQAATATNQTTGGGESHENMSPYIVLNKLIRIA